MSLKINQTDSQMQTPVLGIPLHIRTLKRDASHASLRMLKKRFGFFRNMSTYKVAELVEVHLIFFIFFLNN